LKRIADAGDRYDTKLPRKLYGFDDERTILFDNKKDSYAILSHSSTKSEEVKKALERSKNACDYLDIKYL